MGPCLLPRETLIGTSFQNGNPVSGEVGTNGDPDRDNKGPKKCVLKTFVRKCEESTSTHGSGPSPEFRTLLVLLFL